MDMDMDNPSARLIISLISPLSPVQLYQRRQAHPLQLDHPVTRSTKDILLLWQQHRLHHHELQSLLLIRPMQPLQQRYAKQPDWIVSTPTTNQHATDFFCTLFSVVTIQLLRLPLPRLVSIESWTLAVELESG